MKHIASFLTVAMILGGCSQEIANTKQLDDEAAKMASSSGMSAAEVCNQASQSVTSGNDADLRFFAPLHMEQAIENLKEGQKLLGTPQTASQGVQKCHKSIQLIKDGLSIKAKAKDMLKDAMAEHDQLRKVDSAKKYTKDIQDYLEDIQDLIKQIETGKINDAMKGQAELIKDMQETEIEIVLDVNLTPVEAMLDKAEDADADELAEVTFEKAEKELDSAKKYITANFRNNEEVRKTSEQAMLAAKHAYYVAKEVETLQKLEPAKAEEKVLYIESLLEGVNKRFNQGEIVGHSLYEQADILGKRVDAIIGVHTSTVVMAPEPKPATSEVKPETPQAEATDNNTIPKAGNTPETDATATAN
jgi:hypothetical protein